MRTVVNFSDVATLERSAGGGLPRVGHCKKGQQEADTGQAEARQGPAAAAQADRQAAHHRTGRVSCSFLHIQTIIASTKLLSSSNL